MARLDAAISASTSRSGAIVSMAGSGAVACGVNGSTGGHTRYVANGWSSADPTRGKSRAAGCRILPGQGRGQADNMHIATATPDFNINRAIADIADEATAIPALRPLLADDHQGIVGVDTARTGDDLEPCARRVGNPHCTSPFPVVSRWRSPTRILRTSISPEPV